MDSLYTAILDSTIAVLNQSIFLPKSAKFITDLYRMCKNVYVYKEKYFLHTPKCFNIYQIFVFWRKFFNLAIKGETTVIVKIKNGMNMTFSLFYL